MNERGTAAPTDHRGLRVLGFDECVERLGRPSIGRLAFVSAGESVILPVNHATDGDVVVFKTRPGSKMDVALSAGNVAFEVDGYDDGTRTGWSVLVKGIVEVVYDPLDTARYDRLELDSWADLELRGEWVRIRPLEISGREIVR